MGRSAEPAETFTFGVELEVTLPSAGGRISLGSYNSAGIQVGGMPEGWVAKSDSTISPRDRYYGAEIVSPILSGPAGLMQILQVCERLEEMGARVNRTCGVHVHIGFDRTNLLALENFVWQVANHEKALFASTGTKHREEAQYSRSIHEIWRPLESIRVKSMNDFGRVPQGHYASLNLSNLMGFNKPTVEIRAFAGTTSAVKVCAHVQMCIALVQKAMKSSRRPKWDAPRIVESSRSYRKAGLGSTALARLFYIIGWTKGVEKQLLGFMPGEGLPSLKEMKKELARLGRRYDKA